MRKAAIVLTFLLFCILGISNTVILNQKVLHYATTVAPVSPATATVFSVVDGDTFKVHLDNTVQIVRLIGVDTPETVHPTKGVQPGGPEASRFLKDLLQPGTMVYLTFDTNRTDYYKRLLAYVWIYENQWVLVNYLIIANHYGSLYTKYKFNRDMKGILQEAATY